MILDCCNASCGWRGESQTMLGAVGPLCPECGEVTEPNYEMMKVHTDKGMEYRRYTFDDPGGPIHSIQDLRLLEPTPDHNPETESVMRTITGEAHIVRIK
jgi:hypothetical protein